MVSLVLSSLLFTHLAASQTVVQTIVITVPPSVPSDPPSFVDHDTFTSAVLNSTNFHRTTHNASAVRWNTTLAAFASSYLSYLSPQSAQFFPSHVDFDFSPPPSKASTRASSCPFHHSGGPYGENLALGCTDAGGCVDAWGAEARAYDYADPRFAEASGHFTQLVWRDTTDLGCAAARCPASNAGRGWYLVCEYWPRGNVVGAFAAEVGEPESGAGGLGRRGNGGSVGVAGRGVEVLVVCAAVVAWWGLV